MHTELSLKEIQKEWHGSLKSYGRGFILSLLLTTASFSLVAGEYLEGHALLYTLMALALTQAVVQLIFFLHLGQEASPKWELIAFCFMVMVLLIIAIGSLWIMDDLDKRVMSDMHSPPAPSHIQKDLSHD
jgi:cytochrome o ubiquinol oxidase operon protein cyoD